MIIYEDAVVKAELLEDGAMIGHIVCSPKQDALTLADLPGAVSVQLFYLASYAATAVFEGLGAQGTNIVVTEGDGVRVNVVPRKDQDGLDLYWNPERADPSELDAVASKVSDALWYVGRQDDSAKPSQAPKEPDGGGGDREVASAKKSYNARQLRHTP